MMLTGYETISACGGRRDTFGFRLTARTLYPAVLGLLLVLGSGCGRPKPGSPPPSQYSVRDIDEALLNLNASLKATYPATDCDELEKAVYQLVQSQSGKSAATQAQTLFDKTSKLSVLIQRRPSKAKFAATLKEVETAYEQLKSQL